MRRGVSSLAWAVVGGALLAPAPAAGAGPEATKERNSVLVASIGPRGGDWTRVFNPFLDGDDTRWPARAGVYEPLLVFLRATGRYKPWLAVEHQWGPGNKSLRFSLREGVLWSDGVPFSSADVVFTFNLLRRFSALDRAHVWSFLTDVKAVDATTVEFVFKQVHTPALFDIGTQPIVSEHKWKDVAQPGAFNDPTPVGTGPFVEVRRFEPAVYELGKNPKYWQKGKPAVDVLRVPAYRSNDEILHALGEAELDWASLFVDDVEKRWVATNPSRHLYWFPDYGQPVLLYLNTQHKPFDNAGVRKAISLALDRGRIVSEALNGYVQPADATGLAASEQRWKDAALVQRGSWTVRNPAEANRLLDAAGLGRGAGGGRTLPGGGPMRYVIQAVEGWSDWIAALRIIRENLAEVGIDVSVKPLPYDAWHDALELGRFDMGLWFGSRGPTPYDFYRGQLDPALVRPVGERASASFHRFGSPEAGRLLQRLAASADAADQEQLCHGLQEIFVDSAPSLPLFAAPLWGVFNTVHVTGFPSRYNPYGSAVPGADHSDAILVLAEVKPRE